MVVGLPVGCAGWPPSGSDGSGGAIRIGTGADAAAVVAAAPPGSTFVFSAGTHRQVEVTARDGDRFAAEAGAVLSGAVVLGAFGALATDGGTAAWAAPLPPSVIPQPPSGPCQTADGACGWPEELFVDGRPLVRVVEVAAVGPGRWALDPTGRRVVVGEDPGTAVAELSVSPVAISGAADDVVVDGVRFEHYANPANIGVLHMGEGAERWQVRDCTVRDAHGVGVVLRDGASITGCRLEGNGQQGLGATGRDVVVDGNTIVGNNRAGFDPGWSAGGAKFAVTTGLRVLGNEVSGNDGPGLWTDVDCVDTRYEGNVVRDNTAAGIQHEISWDAVITGNVVTGNGSRSPGWVWGAGIAVVNSADVRVEGNTVEGNHHAIIGIDQVRGAGSRGEWRLSGLVVEGNVVRSSGQTGIAQDHGDTTVYDRGHHFDGNGYHGSATWSWLDAERSWTEWQGFGHDPAGAFAPGG